MDVKEKIIEKSIELLKRDGLKFCIDELANEMKISKKTIYKNFANKEELATEIYSRFYFKSNISASDISSSKAMHAGNTKHRVAMLNLYFQSATINHRGIFNKFSLNESIMHLAAAGHDMLWRLVVDMKYCAVVDTKIYRLVVDGSFGKIISEGIDSTKVIQLLASITI